jgi:hypothetical protein
MGSPQVKIGVIGHDRLAKAFAAFNRNSSAAAPAGPPSLPAVTGWR